MATKTLHLNGTGRTVLLTRAALRDRLPKKQPVVEVPVPELAESDGDQPIVLMRRLSGPERRVLGAWEMEGRAWDDDERRRREKADGWEGVITRNTRARVGLVLFCAVDTEGQLLWDEPDINAFADSEPAVFDWLHAAAVVHNGMPRQTIADHLVKRAEALGIGSPVRDVPFEERLKNSPAAPGSSSSTN